MYGYSTLGSVTYGGLIITEVSDELFDPYCPATTPYAKQDDEIYTPTTSPYSRLPNICSV